MSHDPPLGPPEVQHPPELPVGQAAVWSRKFPVVDGIDIQGYVDLQRRKLGFLLHVAGWPQPLRLRRGQLSAAAGALLMCSQHVAEEASKHKLPTPTASKPETRH